MLHGLKGAVTVNGKTFNSVMPPMSQPNDDEITNFFFVRNTFGTGGAAVSADDVKTVRASSQAPPGAAR